jgi:hypothetical protein
MVVNPPAKRIPRDALRAAQPDHRDLAGPDQLVGAGAPELEFRFHVANRQEHRRLGATVALPVKLTVTSASGGIALIE